MHCVANIVLTPYNDNMVELFELKRNLQVVAKLANKNASAKTVVIVVV